MTVLRTDGCSNQLLDVIGRRCRHRAFSPVPAGVLFFLCVLVVSPGCGPSREVVAPQAPARVKSTVGGLSYRTPSGWWDFSADSSRPGLLWLIRSDYAATIVVDDVHTELLSGEDPGGKGEGIARALLQLDTGSGGNRAEEPVRGAAIPGKEAWSYILRAKNGEPARVVIVTNGKRFLRCVLTLHGGVLTQDAAGTQDAFLQELFW